MEGWTEEFLYMIIRISSIFISDHSYFFDCETRTFTYLYIFQNHSFYKGI